MPVLTVTAAFVEIVIIVKFVPQDGTRAETAPISAKEKKKKCHYECKNQIVFKDGALIHFTKIKKNNKKGAK